MAVDKNNVLKEVLIWYNEDNKNRAKILRRIFRQRSLFYAAMSVIFFV